MGETQTKPKVAQQVSFDEPESKGQVAVCESQSNGITHIEPPTPQPVIQRDDVAKLAGAITKVMGDIGTVEKTGEHKYFHYSYLTANDLLTKLTPLMAKNGIAVIQDEISRAFVEGTHVSATYEFTIMHESGAIWPHRPRFTGLSLAKSEKGGFDAACLNKCAIAARKYFLLSLFQIPASDVDDADEGANDHSPQQRTQPQKQPPQRAPNPSKVAPPENRAPCTFPAKGSRKAWAQTFINAIAGVKTAAELHQWRQLNEEALADIKANEPQLYSDLADKYTKLAAKFAPPAPENGTAFDLDSPETWAANPDVLLKAVEAKCKTFEDVSDLDKWFYDNIEFHLADANLFPPDVQQVKDIVDRYLKRHHK